MRRLVLLISATVAFMALFAGTAFAHFCYNASRSDKGNAGAAQSSGFFTFGGFIEEAFADCDEHTPEELIAAGEAAGLRMDAAIHAHTVMAGGLFTKDSALLHNNKGIDHSDLGALDSWFVTVVVPAAIDCGVEV